MAPLSPNNNAGSNGDPPAAFLDQLHVWLQSNDFSDNTIKLYAFSVNKWLRFVSPWKDRWQIRSIEWRKSLTGLALKSQSVMVGAAKSFVEHLLEEGVLEGRNPFLKVKFRGLATAYMHRRSLSDDEVKKMFRSCDLNTEEGLRDHTVLMIMLHTAIRIGGVSSICVEDVEKQGDYWVVKYQGKGQRSKDKIKVLPPLVVTAIKAYLKKTGRTLGGNGPLFLQRGKKFSVNSMRRSIVKRLKDCGIKDSSVTTHSLRHTAATKAIDSGNDIKAVQELLDHSNLATTDRYIHSVRQAHQAAGVKISYGDAEDGPETNDMEGDDAGQRTKKKRRRKGS